MLRHLRRDPFVIATFFSLLALIGCYLLYNWGVEIEIRDLGEWFDFVWLGLVLAGLLTSRGGRERLEDRVFWKILTISFMIWLLAELAIEFAGESFYTVLFTLFDEIRVGGKVVARAGRLAMIDDDGKEYLARKPDLVEVEEVGPMRVCVRVKGKYMAGDGSPLFDYEVRIHAFAGQPFVRVNHNYVCRMKQGAAKKQNEIKIRSMSIKLPLVGSASPPCLFGTDAGGPLRAKLAGAPIEARQKYESEATIAGKAFKRLPGWVAVGDAMVAIEHPFEVITVPPAQLSATSEVAESSSIGSLVQLIILLPVTTQFSASS